MPDSSLQSHAPPMYPKVVAGQDGIAVRIRAIRVELHSLAAQPRPAIVGPCRLTSQVLERNSSASPASHFQSANTPTKLHLVHLQPM